MAAAPLNVCVDFSHHSWTQGDPQAPARLVDLARAADDGGADSIWVSEDPEGWDAFAVLGALAVHTKRARLGTGVTNPYLRHPNLIAASVASLDQLSGGRAFLGLGRGQTEWYQRALGIDTGKPLAVLAETLDLLDAWWSGNHRATASGYFNVTNWERTVVPFGRPPVYLAAAGPKALTLTGQRADGVVFNELASVDYLRDAVNRVKQAAEGAGRNPGQLSFFARTSIYFTDDPGPELERRKQVVALIHALPGMERLLASPRFDTEQISADVRRAMKTEEILARGGGFPELRRLGDLEAARAAIPAELMAELAVVGSNEHIQRRLQILSEIGITHVFIDRRQIDMLNRLRDLQ